MGAAATMLRESEFNVSGGKSMKPLERAAKTSWKYNGAHRDDEMIGQGWSGENPKALGLVRWRANWS